MVGSHGRFVWYELMTSDVQAAKVFYASVVGWGTRDRSMLGMPYTLFTVGEASVSGLLGIPPAAGNMGARPSWIGYVGVDDVDATVDRIRHLGGAVHVPPGTFPTPAAIRSSLTPKKRPWLCSSG